MAPALRRLALGFLVTIAGGAACAATDTAWDREAIQALLRKGAGVNVARPDGMTPLHWAVFHDDPDLVAALLRARADVAATNRYGVSPLSLACQNGSAVIVELLLDAGADPNGALRGGETALMTAARTGRPGPVAALLRRGADPQARERRGQTALMWAAAEGHAEVVELLVRFGSDPRTALPDSGFTAFHFAAREGRREVVKVLLEAGVPVDATLEPAKPSSKGPRRGTSALLLAVENGHFELALDLVRAGADPNDQRSGFTPLHVLTWVRKPQRGEDDGDPAPLGSGGLGSLEFVRRLVAAGAGVNVRLAQGRGGPGLYNTTGATPFLMASATADLEYLKLLVALGADAALTNAEGCTPLMVACGIGVGASAANEVAGEEPEVLEVAQWLVGLGADVNAVDANGETAMHGAALKNLPRVVQFLADHGARVEVWNRKNRYGWTPLLLARGHRPGNFKPSAETIAALEPLLRAAGIPVDGASAGPPAGPGYPPQP